MKIYEYHICWRYSSENWEVGLVKANSKEEAETKIKKANPDIVNCHVYETEFDEDGICVVYSH